jgi:putative tryptophan/tyrosine transport system ATP-binding protein
MDSGKVILEVEGEDKQNLTIEALLQEFQRIKGTKMNNDRALLG